jgi:hypothetical protein
MGQDEKWFNGEPLNDFSEAAGQVFDMLFSKGIVNVEGDANNGEEPVWDPGLIVRKEVRSDINHAFNHLER